MIPAIFPGDTLQIIPLIKEPEPGDILVVMTPAGIILHRYISTTSSEPRQLVLKGDHNNHSDPPVDRQLAIGQVIATRLTIASFLSRISYRIKWITAFINEKIH